MKDLIILDTETTGVEAKRDSIIEIAAVKLSDGKIVGEFQTLVKPANPLNVTVSVLTGIQPTDLENAPDIKVAGQKFLEFAGDLPIVGHNVSFDIDFLKSHGIDPVGRSLDTLDLAMTIFPKLPYHSMQYICEAYQFKNRPSHRAMSDVLATAELVNLLVYLAQTIPANILKNIRELSAKSDWEWSFIFDDAWIPPTPALLPSTRHATPLIRHPELASGSFLKMLKLIQHDVVSEIKPGFNVYELSPELPQMATNIALSTNDDKSVLVVSNEVFHKQNWSECGLNSYFGSVLQLDVNRFNFLINKPKLRSTEFKLLVKILLTDYPNKSFNPNNVYLVRDEFYLWEQKLSPFSYQLKDLPTKTVMNFASFYEILESNPKVLKNRHIYLPQWIEFDEWATNKSAKMFTLLYVNALIASRRDFVHDFVTDNKSADELFKLLNNLGGELNDWWKNVEELWGEQDSGSPIEISGLLVADKVGKTVMTKTKTIIETLNNYLEKLKSTSLDNQLAQQKQIEHTTNLLEHLQLLTRPGQSAKNYLNGYNGRVILNVVKQPVPNIWQSPPTPPLDKGRMGGVGLKGLHIIIASNGVLVNSKPDFISALLGESIQVVSIRHSGEPTGRLQNLISKRSWTSQDDDKKPISFISGLPDRNRDDNYQSDIFEYITEKIINPKDKTLVVFPNVAIMVEFFEMYKPILTNINLFSQNVAGNVEMLKDKLSALESFTLLISGTNLSKFLKVLDGLDKTVFMTMPFDVPGSLGSVLAKDKFRNEFTEYGLPKVIVKFRVNLAELYSKTKETVILDSRLISTDWGLTVPQSLSGFHIIKI